MNIQSKVKSDSPLESFAAEKMKEFEKKFCVGGENDRGDVTMRYESKNGELDKWLTQTLSALQESTLQKCSDAVEKRIKELVEAVGKYDDQEYYVDKLWEARKIRDILASLLPKRNEHA